MKHRYIRTLALTACAVFVGHTLAADEQPQELKKVDVKGYVMPDDAKPKLDFIMKEVDGAQITVTKKTSITKLDNLPTIIGNNPREVFAQTPGLYVAEQQIPGQVNLSYRGIGNPQESEYVGVFQDGIPLEGDWIGFPTLYVFPLPQTISQVQMIRGGSSLLYGPEPPPAINLVSAKPSTQPMAGYTENVIGNDGLFATFNKVSGTQGNWDYLVDVNYRKNDGQRDNGDSKLGGADLHIGYRADETSYTALDFHAYDLNTGNAGLLTYLQYTQNPDTTATPYDRLWTQRYVLSVSHDRHLSENTQLIAKVWTGYQDQASRSQDRGAAPTTATLQDEQFRFAGIDARLVHHWGYGNALTVGTTLYHSDAPFRQWDDFGLASDQYDRPGIVCTSPAATDCAKLRQARSTNYGALFAENVFRLPHQWHVVPSVRLEHEQVNINETIKPPTLNRGLVDRSVDHTVPLLGLGIGNDFGHLNESYFNISQGWRPVRYFDIASPFGSTNSGPLNDPDPTHVLSYELGVHGTPVHGLFYDVSVFQVNVKNRIESEQIANAPLGNTINVNTGDTRSRGFEGEVSYDFLQARDLHTTQHLSVFANLSLLHAEFTSTINPANLGNTPAFSPKYLARAGITYREDQHLKVALSAVSVASQYYSDANITAAAPFLTPAKVPAYTVADFSADYWVLPQLRLLGGVSNLTNKIYYSRVFLSSGIEPAPGRTYYAGFAYEF
ncbi:MAG: TonB-dependent receptor family protein [Rudaea sp.]